MLGVLRVLTLGLFLEERLGEWMFPRHGGFGGVVGLVVLAAGIWGLAGAMP